MKLLYTISTNKKREKQITDEFCVYISKKIFRELYRELKHNTKTIESIINNTTAISWVNKPKKVNAGMVINVILDNIKCYKVPQKNIYIIRFSDNLFLESNNTIDSIVRLLDKGNEKYIGTHIFTKIFTKYEHNINLYWRLFVMYKLKKIPTSVVIVVK